jgi:hypothetical protein
MEQKLQIYQFTHGWQAVFPAGWEQVFNEKTKENMFSPPDSDLVFRLAMLHIADKAGKPAPLKVMEEALEQVLPPSNKSLNTDGLDLGGLLFKSRVTEADEDGEHYLRITAAYYCEGDMLVINLTGTDEKEVLERTALLRLVRKADEKASS